MQLRALIPVLSVALLAVHKVSTATVTFDCARVPNICSNDCFAIQCSVRVGERVPLNGNRIG